jgi:hypothetical protein
MKPTKKNLKPNKEEIETHQVQPKTQPRGTQTPTKKNPNAKERKF